MKITRFVSLFTALIAVVGLWGFVFVDDATAGGTGICVTPDGRNVPCSSPGGGGGPGGGGPAGPTPEELEQAWEEQDLQEAADDANDTAIEFYEKGDWANAISYFKKALEYTPDDDDILYNLHRAEEKLEEEKRLAKEEPKLPTVSNKPDLDCVKRCNWSYQDSVSICRFDCEADHKYCVELASGSTTGDDNIAAVMLCNHHRSECFDTCKSTLIPTHNACVDSCR